MEEKDALCLRQKNMKEVRKNQLKFFVSDYELDQIRDNAKACDKTVSAYAREVLLNMTNIDIDYKAIVEHTEKLAAIHYAIIQLVFTIRKSGNYAPKDLEYIVAKMNTVLEMENELSQKHSEYVEISRREIRREARRIVRERLEKQAKTK